MSNHPSPLLSNEGNKETGNPTVNTSSLRPARQSPDGSSRMAGGSSEADEAIPLLFHLRLLPHLCDESHRIINIFREENK